MGSSERIGNWSKIKVLGSGGFGIVSLWKNDSTEKMVALKMCREGSESFISSKHKDRWANEVDIMLRLSHPNVVKAEPIPDDLTKLSSYLPILCMEYCSKGDLRKILNMPENCCGLQEPEIRNILRDVESAVKFLHKQKITHRDLKPENIVLQENSNHEIVYKLIDLGYAKELDQSSLCSSFVGTIQYLAPELFTQVYTSSVDYWSFGLVCHEIITGVRPFLPHMTPVSWMNHVKQKSSEDICIYQNPDGSIEYSQELFAENHITQCFRYEFEKWLRLTLEWDGNKRGRSSDNTLILFSSLENILNKKIVTVFSVTTYEKLSYEVDNSTAIATLQLWVERDTKQPIAEQLLLLPSGEKLKTETLAYTCWDTTQDVMVYIFSKKGLKLPDVPPKLPPLVVRMLEAPKVLQPYFYLRRSWPNAVFFIHTQLSLYQTFLEAYAVKMLSIILQNVELSKLEHSVTNELQQVIAKQKLNNDSVEYDIKCYSKLQHDSSEPDLKIEWQEKAKTCNKKVQQLKEFGEKLGSKVTIVVKKLALLQTFQEPGQIYVEKLKTLLELSYKVYESLRRRPKESRDTMLNSVDMVKVVYNCLKERDRMLRDQHFTAHLQEITDYENEIINMMSPLNSLRQHILKCNNEVTRCQLLRQKDIWQLVFNLKMTPANPIQVPLQQNNSSLSPTIGNSLVMPTISHPPSPGGSLQSNTKIQSNSDQPAMSSTSSIPTQHLAVNGFQEINNTKGVDEVCKGKSSVNNSSASISEDTKSMITDNQNLRFAIQECMVKSYQNYHKILVESQAFDWNSMLKN